MDVDIKNSLEQTINNLNSFFYSIQGEGIYSGIPTLFFRFNKCNLKCEYCDTDFNGKLIISPNDFMFILIKYFKNYPIKQVCFTGGEPMLFTNDISLICNVILPYLNIRGLTAKIETNGLFDLRHIVYDLNCYAFFTITPKLDNNGMYRHCYDSWYMNSRKIEFKFMLDPYNKNFSDELVKIQSFLIESNLLHSNIPIFLSPINKDNNPSTIIETCAELVRKINKSDNIIVMKDIRYNGISIQLHKLLEFE